MKKLKTWDLFNEHLYQKDDSEFEDIMKVNLIVDISASVQLNNLNKELTKLFHKYDEINIIYCDNEVRLDQTITSAYELPNIPGAAGGTDLIPAIDYVGNKYPQEDTYIYTDITEDEIDDSEYNYAGTGDFFFISDI